MKELCWAVNKLKRNKASGPDGVPTYVFKEMEEPQLELILALLNIWWNGQETPDSLTQAQVILLYKKGDNNNLSSYRPISLLNTMYKILTTLLQQRLSEVLDTHLQQSQFGFRKNKGTAQAIHYI